MPVSTPAGERLVIRQPDGSLKAFVNRCRHNGTALATRLRCTGDGSLTCPYHGWRYNADGSLAHVPLPGSFPGLNPAAVSLEPAGLTVQGGVVLVSTDPQQPPDGLLTGLGNLLEKAGVPGHRVVFRHTFTVQANWKCAVEQGLETYHALTAHAKTLARHLDYEGVTHEQHGDHWLGLFPVRAPLLARLSGVMQPGTLFHRALLFPACMVSTPVPGRHMAITAVTPLGPTQCRVTFVFGFRRGGWNPLERLTRPLSLWASRRILREDLMLLEGRQRGLEASEKPLVGFGGYEEGARTFCHSVTAHLP